MRIERSRIPVLVFAMAGLALTAACSDQPAAPPAAEQAGGQSLRNEVLIGTYNGVEYEIDTGEVACPAILNSHVKYWVNINAIGPRLFTFFAPHTRIGYLGDGVYRYRMTLGRSDVNEWLAEGSWTGKCIGYAQWGIGRVLSFEGTVWRSGASDGDECGAGGDGGWYYMESYDPYSPAAEEGTAVSSSCGSGSSSGGFNPGSYSCYWDYITLEISYDGGQTWQPYWSGWAQICDEQMA
jgi:hypothetical protein